MRFNFVAKTREGQFKSGVVDAPTKDLALVDLQREGLIVISLSEKSALKLPSIFVRVSLKDLAVYTRQFAALVNARVPILDALRALYKQTANPSLREVTFEIIKDVEGGLLLSQAFARHSSIFSSLYIQLLEIAEIVGTMDKTLAYLADYLQKQNNLESKAKSAAVYPLIVVVVFAVVMLVMFTWIIPQMGVFFKQANIELPFLTRMFLGISYFIVGWWWIVLLMILAFAYVILLYSRTHEGKVFLDAVFLNIPYFGEVFKRIYLARFAETVSTLVSGGIPIAQSLDIAADVAGNETYSYVFRYAADGLRRGGQLSEILDRYPTLFPPMVVEMIATGEKTGQIVELLRNSANFLTEELERSLSTLVEVIQPILIIILGVGVGLLGLSILMPIYSLTRAIGAGAL